MCCLSAVHDCQPQLPSVQERPELDLSPRALQCGYAVSREALGILDSDEAHLTLLPAAAAWAPGKLEAIRQVSHLIQTGFEHCVRLQCLAMGACCRVCAEPFPSPLTGLMAFPALLD